MKVRNKIQSDNYNSGPSVIACIFHLKKKMAGMKRAPSKNNQTRKGQWCIYLQIVLWKSRAWWMNGWTDGCSSDKAISMSASSPIKISRSSWSWFSKFERSGFTTLRKWHWWYFIILSLSYVKIVAIDEIHPKRKFCLIHQWYPFHLSKHFPILLRPRLLYYSALCKTWKWLDQWENIYRQQDILRFEFDIRFKWM